MFESQKFNNEPTPEESPLVLEAMKKAETYDNPGYLAGIVENITGDEAVAEKVKSVTTKATQWVVLMDLWEETGIEDYRAASIKCRAEIDTYLNDEQKEIFQNLDTEIVVPFWIYEKELISRIQESDTFSKQEIEESVFRRSADAVSKLKTH
jgi:hypothetical protein